MNDRSYRVVFQMSALWNLIGGAALILFMRPIFAFSNVPLPDPPVWYYCWIALFFTFGIGILSASRDLYRNILFVRLGILGKVSFSIVYVYFFVRHPGQVPAFVLVGVIGDLIFAGFYAMFLRSAAAVQTRARWPAEAPAPPP